MKTINLPGLLSFSEALNAMLAGHCLGIRPNEGTNANYVELFRPEWQRAGYQLRWSKGTNDQGIRTDQFTGTWALVVVDHRTLTPREPDPQ